MQHINFYNSLTSSRSDGIVTIQIILEAQKLN